MLIPKRKLMDYAASTANKIEHGLVTTLGIPQEKLTTLIGQRAAYAHVFEFIENSTKGRDNIESDDLMAFCESEAKKQSNLAFNDKLGSDYPNDRLLALGKILAYKTMETCTAQTVKENMVSDNDEG